MPVSFLIMEASAVEFRGDADNICYDEPERCGGNMGNEWSIRK